MIKHIFKIFTPSTGNYTFWYLSENNRDVLLPYDGIEQVSGGNSASTATVLEAYYVWTEANSSTDYIGLSFDLLNPESDDFSNNIGKIFNIINTSEDIFLMLIGLDEHGNVNFRNLKTNQVLTFDYYSGQNYDDGNNFEGFIYPLSQINVISTIESAEDITNALQSVNDDISDLDGRVSNLENNASDYVPKSRQIAGLALSSDISTASLKTQLGIRGNNVYALNSSGTYNIVEGTTTLQAGDCLAYSYSQTDVGYNGQYTHPVTEAWYVIEVSTGEEIGMGGPSNVTQDGATYTIYNPKKNKTITSIQNNYGSQIKFQTSDLQSSNS